MVLESESRRDTASSRVCLALSNAFWVASSCFFSPLRVSQPLVVELVDDLLDGRGSLRAGVLREVDQLRAGLGEEVGPQPGFLMLRDLEDAAADGVEVRCVLAGEPVLERLPQPVDGVLVGPDRVALVEPAVEPASAPESSSGGCLGRDTHLVAGLADGLTEQVRDVAALRMESISAIGLRAPLRR
jgi:hypothetical protein